MHEAEDKNLERRSRLSPEKQALLEKRLKGGFADRSRSISSVIPCRSKAGPAPLSFPQQQLWFFDQLIPGSTHFNLPTAARITGPLDVVVLEQCLNEIIRRHEALRTSFTVVEGVPVQVVSPAQHLPVKQVDLLQLPVAEREAEALRLIQAEVRRPFDLAQGPLLRAILLRLGESEYIMLWVMHHIVSDGWSMGVFAREFIALYEAFSTGRPSPLPELPIQYADFAAWQQQWLRGDVVEEHLAYWKRQLADLSVLELPTDRPRPKAETFQGAVQYFKLSTPLQKAIETFNQQEGVTLSMTLLAVFQTWLYRYTGQTDLAVGSPTANRNRVEIEGLIGFFLNMLILRTNLSGQMTFRELVKQVREVTLDAYTHQDMPFERLVEALHPNRDPGRQPLVQAMFDVQSAPPHAMDFAGLSMNLLDIHNGGAKYDLTLDVFERPDGLTCSFEYNTDLFCADTITRMMGHFQTLLESALANPDRQLADLPLLPEAEQHQLLVEWNDPQDYVLHCIHQLFEAQAEQAPDVIALSLEGESLSYGALDARSNQIAHGLQSLGIGPHQPVAIMLEGGREPICVMAGILKAACFFVCLDPNYPAARLEQVLKESQPACLISDAACLDRHPGLLSTLEPASACRVILLPAHDSPQKAEGQIGPSAQLCTAGFEACPTTKPDIQVKPADPAYVVYTSGSTGRPKGIVQSHGSFCQFAEWQSRQFGMHSSRRIALWASITYDASYCEIFGALCFGATLCMTTPAIKYDARGLVEWLRREEIYLLQMVPSFCRQVLRVLEAENAGEHTLPRLEVLMLAGEVLPSEVASAWLHLFPERPRLFNLYGPSEAVLATCYAVKAIPEQRAIPIGRAIDGRQILVLDRDQRLCPVGVKGEIYIRSKYLTLGYFRRPEETQKVFVQNPLHHDHPDPVYRTGDLGRWLPDGALEFWGRIDNQVKIRGMRVELQDIEATLAAHRAIRECAVVVQEYGEADQRLVAYLAAEPGLAMPELRNFLKDKLPNHMLPAAFVLMDQLPRTPSGKLDRKSLPKSDSQRPELEHAYVAPRTEREALIAQVWQNLLHVDKAGIYDNFFDLGGHSLLAVQVINQLRAAYFIDLPLRSFFESPTIAQLAEKIEQAQETTSVEAEKIARLVEQVRNLSDKEVEALLGLKELPDA